VALQFSKSRPMEPSRVSPPESVMPTVSQPSKADVGLAATMAGSMPPTLAPKAPATWYAAGRRHQSMSTKGAQQLQERTW
jgi:hypothetical protein